MEIMLILGAEYIPLFEQKTLTYLCHANARNSGILGAQRVIFPTACAC
ncbi:hypothetical protein Mar181_2287 [Marinomonas posidonica IVIA-Po-181]|uniref:Uncharacterized protein n=1 Tax=Marinomonas posidonica (strain CECT 7376 / NCIMB 14433 / IVIA-Po-181) TaxID=491952 RepID=F6CUZ7_MARPP|nr:hypothetical protein Mar181_2287 [Marinomonas posidonica IVIA-Po-181]